MTGEVGPEELAASLGISPKRLRDWLRAELGAGHPILDGHQPGARWWFDAAEAEQLAREYRIAGGRARAPGQHHQGVPSPARPDPIEDAAEPQQLETSSSAPSPKGGAVGKMGCSGAPPLPENFTRRALAAVGFSGWRTWPALRAGALADVPSLPGVYLVLRPGAGDPSFVQPGSGGHFKGGDPSVSDERLRSEWVRGARTLYIGKAAARQAGGAVDGLNRRIGEFSRFGAGERVGHWGGRLIWQLADVERLLVAWHPITWDETAREYERRLLARFADIHGRRPFANLTG